MRAWSCPPELNQPLPRSFQLSKIYKIMMPLIAIAFLGPALFIIIFAFLVSHQMEALKERGVPTTASITALYVEAGRHGSDPTYFVGYSFSPITSFNYSNNYKSGKSTVFLADYQKLRLGQAVGVIYDPNSPDKSALSLSLNSVWIYPYHNAIWITEVILPIFAGAVALIFAYVGWIYRKEKRLVMWGMAAPAVIVAEKEVSRGRTRKVQITYQFQDEAGFTVEGIRKDLPNKVEMNKDRFLSYSSRITTNPTVLYEASNRSMNMLYPPNTIVCCAPPRNA